MAESAFAINVPEAEQYVGALRERFDPSAKLGVPAHITLLYPFIPPERITDAVLHRVRSVLSSFAAFDFRLAKIGRFRNVLYLAPEPQHPFVALTERLTQEFPGYPPYGGQYESIVPHLTVAQASEAEHDAAEAQLIAALPPKGGIEASGKDVVLIENSSGRWERMHLFQLRRS
jgi:2'-5' RNA ligase